MKLVVENMKPSSIINNFPTLFPETQHLFVYLSRYIPHGGYSAYIIMLSVNNRM